jgi:putative flippase GtrA
MQKLKTLYTEKHREIWELARYVVAGGLTTLVSLIVSYGCYFLMAMEDAAQMPADGFKELAVWIAGVINGATALQVTIGNVISWVIAVVFAFWINRWMVFRVKYENQKDRFKAFFQFVSARVATLLLFEMGLAALLNVLGIPNLVGRLLVLILVMIFNYIASKFWIFKEKSV